MDIPTFKDVLLLPGLLTFLGLVIYGAAWVNLKTNGVLLGFRFFGLALIFCAMLVDAKELWTILDPNTGSFNQIAIATTEGRKTVLAHYGVTFGPLLVIALAVVLELVNKKRKFGQY
jgi:hypothetical protein